MAEARISKSDNYLYEISSENDLFKSLSDLNMAVPIEPATSNYKVSPLVDGTVKVTSSRTITKMPNEEASTSDQTAERDPENIKGKKQKNKRKENNEGENVHQSVHCLRGLTKEHGQAEKASNQN